MDTAADPMTAVADALQVMELWEQRPAVEVLEAVQATPNHLQQALAGQWQTLPRLDRADLYGLQVAAEDLARYGAAGLAQDGVARLAPIMDEAVHFAGIVEPDRYPGSADRRRAVRLAAAHVTTYQRLSPHQQASVLTRLTPPTSTATRLLRSLPGHIPPVAPALGPTGLDTVLSEAAERTAGDTAHGSPTHLGHDLRTRLDALPTEWRQQIMRRLVAGITPLDAISDATRARTLAKRPEPVTPGA
ncbi:hypothetical protein [Streptomyces sp. NPDC001492]